jgi:hypothetical protein
VNIDVIEDWGLSQDYGCGPPRRAHAMAGRRTASPRTGSNEARISRCAGSSK